METLAKKDALKILLEKLRNVQLGSTINTLHYDRPLDTGIDFKKIQKEIDKSAKTHRELDLKTQIIYNHNKMKKTIYTMAMLSALFVVSCKDNTKQETKETNTPSIEKLQDEIVKITSTDKDGKVLEMEFNNTKNTATLNFNGEKIELMDQKPASGFWYKNDHYELRGKGDEVELTKDGKVVFSHKDEIVKSTAKDKNGKVLEMEFNNTKNTAYLNFNGEPIELEGQKPASGIWYKNDHYELRGKGDEVELTKDGKTVFKSSEQK